MKAEACEQENANVVSGWNVEGFDFCCGVTCGSIVSVGCDVSLDLKHRSVSVLDREGDPPIPTLRDGRRRKFSLCICIRCHAPDRLCRQSTEVGVDKFPVPGCCFR